MRDDNRASANETPEEDTVTGHHTTARSRGQKTPVRHKRRGGTSHLDDEGRPPDKTPQGVRTSAFLVPTTRARSRTAATIPPLPVLPPTGSDVTRNGKYLGEESRRTGQKLQDSRADTSLLETSRTRFPVWPSAP